MGFASFWEDHVVLKPKPGAFQADDTKSYMYSNEDMDPIKRKDRTYEWYQMGLFWIAEGFNGAQLQVSSSAFALGLNPGLCVVACLVGNIIVSIPCAASGYMGSKLGTNFPATVRASFGILGAKWAMIVRGIPCIIYYGIQWMPSRNLPTSPRRTCSASRSSGSYHCRFFTLESVHYDICSF
jgi:NCS1 family nucleobase:cation symporter-1